MHVDSALGNAHSRAVLVRRVLIAALICVLALSALLWRVAHLQVTQHSHFVSLADQNRIRTVIVPPPRGRIMDRNGLLLADNQPSFQAEIVAEDVPEMSATLGLLQRLLSLEEGDLARIEKTLKRSRSFDPVTIKLNLSEDEIARLAAYRPWLPGVEVVPRLTRVYPYKSLVSHVVGYVGRISENDLKQVDETDYRGTTHFGKTGIERYYEARLHGRAGQQKVEVDAYGRVLRVLEETPPVPGEDLRLSLDIRLQAVAEAALGDYNGSIVALDVRNGEVLALVSKPGFDANLFVNGISQANYDALIKDPARPLFNRAITATYPPGSTIKPVMGLAGLEHGLITPDTRMFAGPYYQLPNQDHKYRDWKKSGHGWVDLNLALAQSCDVYFYDLAYKMGIDRMHAFLRDFGLGEPSGVDLPGESAGLVPSRDWKRATRNQAWFPGETLIAGIGQGYMLSTPMQLADMTATLMRGGQRLRPHLLPGAAQAPVEDVVLRNPRYWDAARQGMFDVVNGKTGTARRIAEGVPYQIAGKTGTAQVFTVRQNESYDAKKLKRELHDHALFVGYAPAAPAGSEPPPVPEASRSDARIAVAVIAENGGSGSGTAAPIARKVMDAWLLGRVVGSAAPVGVPSRGE